MKTGIENIKVIKEMYYVCCTAYSIFGLEYESSRFSIIMYIMSLGPIKINIFFYVNHLITVTFSTCKDFLNTYYFKCI